MLVQVREPFGQVKLGHRKFYGAATNCGPVDVPYEFFQQFINHLEPATYRTKYLNKHFRGPFPEIAFKLDELRYLPRKTLETLAYGMTIHTDPKHTSKKIILSIQARLHPCLDR